MKRNNFSHLFSLFIPFFFLLISCNDDTEVKPASPTKPSYIKIVSSQNYFPDGGFLVLHETDGTFLESITVTGDGTYEFKDLKKYNYTLSIIKRNNHQNQTRYRIETLNSLENGEIALVGNNYNPNNYGRARIVSVHDIKSDQTSVNSIPFRDHVRTGIDSTKFTTLLYVHYLSNAEKNRIALLSTVYDNDGESGNYEWFNSDYKVNQVNTYQYSLSKTMKRKRVSSIGDLVINEIKLFSKANPGNNNHPPQRLLHFKNIYNPPTGFPYILYAEPQPNDFQYYVTQFTHNETDQSYYKSTFIDLIAPSAILEYYGATVKAQYDKDNKVINDIQTQIANNADAITSIWTYNDDDILWLYTTQPEKNKHILPKFSDAINTAIGLNNLDNLKALGIHTNKQSDIAKYQEYIKQKYSFSSKHVNYNIRQFSYFYFFEIGMKETYKAVDHQFKDYH
ncbi:MAG: hypothetical protein ACEPOW_07235 [Bacteroidales bacterium]